jgi:predicted Zn-dependent protease
VVGWSAISAWASHRRVASQDLLARAIDAFGDATAARSGEPAAQDGAAALVAAREILDELVGSFGGTDAGRAGLYYRGAVALRQGRTADAVADLTAFVEAHPDHDLVPQALAATATALEDAGNAADAEAALRRLTDGAWHLYPEDAALMELARFYERQGRREEAHSVYERLSTTEAFAKSPYAPLARQRLDG